MSSLELRSGSIPSANDKPEHEQQSLSLHDPKHDHDTIWSTDHSHHSHDHEHERESLSAPKREHFSNVDANLARLHPLDVLLFSGNDMIARGIKNIVASSNRISGNPAAARRPRTVASSDRGAAARHFYPPSRSPPAFVPGCLFHGTRLPSHRALPQRSNVADVDAD